MTGKRMTWADLKRERMADPETQAGYDRAQRAYTLGVQVRELRQERGWSQAELRQRAGMTQATIARIEGGAGILTIDSLERIGNAFGVDLVVRFELRSATSALA